MVAANGFEPFVVVVAVVVAASDLPCKKCVVVARAWRFITGLFRGHGNGCYKDSEIVLVGLAGLDHREGVVDLLPCV